MLKKLLNDFRNNAGADRTATFADSETKTFIHRDGADEFHSQVYVITRHNHFGTSW
jgi:hypothetical protein